MAQTKDIKRRIQGIGSIMQITNAMELVASAKLRKIRNKLDKTKPYLDTVYENINQVLQSSNEKSDLMEVREVKNRAIILVSSDKGLAGGYNINVVNKALKYIENDENINNYFYTTGIKSIELLRRRNKEVNSDFTSISDDPVIEDSAAIGSYFVNKFRNNEFDEVLIAYTKFNSMISYEPRVIKVLPAGFVEDQTTTNPVRFEFEPSASRVLTQMIKQYINVTIYGCILESAVAEQASRRTAMENATSNGEELLEDLQLEYNRARQASITQEITEIVGGAEALN